MPAGHQNTKETSRTVHDDRGVSRGVDAEQLRRLISAVATGEASVDEALQQLTVTETTGDGWVDLGFARVDTDRHARTGDPEVVFAAGKTPAQTVAIVATLRRAHPTRPTIVTRADAATTRALQVMWPDAATTTLPTLPTTTLPANTLPANGPPTHTSPTVSPMSDSPAAATATAAAAAAVATAAADVEAPAPSCCRGGCCCADGRTGPVTVVIGPWPKPRGSVLVVSAGTSDAPVATEAAMTARASGSAVEYLPDVGVAGIHRLLARRAALDAADCLVVIAGMEGALPSVVGGLVGTPIVAVPTSVGYGASFGGLAALLAMLNSCAPGIAVCNIDNGFGAGLFAARVARRTVGNRLAPG